ncbi:hypothetical protein BRADI_2g05212v3 [Brachypodium distachyon]|uniref:Uncharacterized protein n=1 Tax=Brachypodium distachyon TaxID=15368 RepID=A0A0Q3FXQ0_BRADI|nr:hypothetical protein BRADI_2g05212v3 [Brachypodium distachyon]
MVVSLLNPPPHEKNPNPETTPKSCVRLGWRAAAVQIAASIGGASGSSGRNGRWQLRGAACERRCVAATGDAAGRLDPRRHRRLQPRRWLQRRRLGPERGEARQARAGGLPRARRAQGLLLQRLDLSRDFTAAAGGDVRVASASSRCRTRRGLLRCRWSYQIVLAVRVELARGEPRRRWPPRRRLGPPRAR